MKHLALIAALLPGLAHADALRFDDSWQDFTFRRYTPTTYERLGDRLRIRGEGTSSMLFRVLPPELRDTRRASWRWKARRSVGATDLGRRGGEDRNLALYFVFTDPVTAARIKPGARASRVLGRNARVLVYAWGDQVPPGTRKPNPYDPQRGVIYILRPAGTGEARESRDLLADYRAAFGEEPGKLVAVAVAADSDDTGSALDSELSDLRLE